MTQLKSGVSFSSILFLAITLGACASGPPATQVSASIAAANEAIIHARNDNALSAAPDLAMEAERKLTQAQTAAKSGDNTTADRLANEAKADAELADATAQNMKSQQAAQTVHSDITTLQQTTAPK
jgi:Domain of unknown function (DUF4398)